VLHRDVVRAVRGKDGAQTWERGGGELLGIILALDGDRAEIDHGHQAPEDLSDEHVFVDEPPGATSRFPRGRASFVVGDEYRMARRDEYLLLPAGLG